MDNAERRENEIQLLLSMYPEEMTYNVKSEELVFKTATASLMLRLPTSYPSSGLPELVSVTDLCISRKNSSLRDEIRQSIDQQNVGEECLDTVVATFVSATERDDHPDVSEVPTNGGPKEQSPVTSKTIVIWLHHLLSTTKRKMALASDDDLISGVTKPGYPGVMIFSGPAKNVTEHVNQLKALNWAAFQIRLEVDHAWHFSHGDGVVECETMGDVVRDVNTSQDQKNEFLEAMKIK